MERPSKSEIAKAYKRAFANSELVLKDLEAVCYARHTTFVAGDSHATALHEGMRMVLLHIQNYLNVNPKDLEDTRG